MDISGKVAFVTGSGRGIGRVIAIPLAETGAYVAVNYKENKSAAGELISAISRPEQVAAVAVMLGRYATSPDNRSISTADSTRPPD